MDHVPQPLLVHSWAHPECVFSLTSAITCPQSCTMSPTSHAHPLLCLVNFLQKMITLIPLPQLPLPGFCSLLFSALMAITCQQFCFEFLTFSMKSKLSLNTAHHFQNTLHIYVEQPAASDRATPPFSSLLAPLFSLETRLVTTHLNQEYLGLSPHCAFTGLFLSH